MTAEQFEKLKAGDTLKEFRTGKTFSVMKLSSDTTRAWVKPVEGGPQRTIVKWYSASWDYLQHTKAR